MARTGQQYLASLRANQPRVFLGGRRVEDVTHEPLFVEPLRAICAQYDAQHEPRYQDLLTCESANGERFSTSFLIPSGSDDMMKLRRAFKLRSDMTFGFMGRAPDFMNTVVTALHLARPLFEKNDPRFGENVTKNYERARDRDIFMTHLVATAQNDRSKTSAQQHDPTMHLHRVRDTPEGIVVSGAKMLGTLAPIAEEVMVFPMGGVAPGDEKYAVSFTIPNATKGLTYICRETVAPLPRGRFDHPLSSRFEEMDCIAVFEDVLVPWDRVFLDGTEASRLVAGPITGAISARAEMQGCSRLLSQMEFFCGLAMRVAQAIGIDGVQHVQEKLGEMLVELELARAAYWSGGPPTFMALNLHSRDLYARYVEIVKQLAAGGFFYAPTEADFENAEIRDSLSKYLAGRGTSARDRVALFKLAWDATGDSFGQRMAQYCRFYSGDPVRVRGMFFAMHPGKDALSGIVDRALSGGADVPLPEAPSMDGPPRPPPKAT